MGGTAVSAGGQQRDESEPRSGRSSRGSTAETAHPRTAPANSHEPGERRAGHSEQGHRRTRQELRDLLLQAGRELLWEEGLAAGAEHVTFARVFARLEASEGIRVTHASVIRRIWRNVEEFQTEVVARLAAADQWNAGVQLDAQLGWAIDAIGPTGTDPGARWSATTEVVRVGGAAIFDSVARSPVWPRFAGLWAMAMADRDCDRKRPIVDALQEGERRIARRYESLFGAAIRGLGLRLRDPFTLHQFAVLVGAFSEGSAIRERVDASMSERIDRPTGPVDETRPWTLFTVGLDALTTAFLEVDPHWQPLEVTAHPTSAPTPASAGAGHSDPRGAPAAVRRRREELRELLLSTAVDLLVEDGLASGAAHLGFRRVFEHVEATTGVRLHNASVIGRIWPNQSAFQEDVLRSVADEVTEIMDRTGDGVVALLAACEGSTPAARWRSLGQLCRVGGAATLGTLAASRRWQRWVGVWSLALAREGNDDGSSAVGDALQRGFAVTSARYEELLRSVIDHLGLRVRPGLTLAQLTAAATALIEGSVLRYQGRARSAGVVVRPTGPNGEPEEWPLFAVGLEALLRGFLELDDGPASALGSRRPAVT